MSPYAAENEFVVTGRDDEVSVGRVTDVLIGCNAGRMGTQGEGKR